MATVSRICLYLVDFKRHSAAISSFRIVKRQCHQKNIVIQHKTIDSTENTPLEFRRFLNCGRSGSLKAFSCSVINVRTVASLTQNS